MSNLTKSFVRGFGFSLGAFAAKKTIDAASKVDPSWRIGGLSTRRQWYALGLWALFLIFVSPMLGIGVVFTWFIFGLFITYYIQKRIQNKVSKKEYSIERALIFTLIENAHHKLKLEGIDPEPSVPLTECSNLELRNYVNQVERMVERTGYMKRKYSGEILDKMLNGNVWTGMTIENLKDLRGNPTQIEVSENSKTLYETLIYGKNKWSGDVFEFRNGSLHSYKDR